MQIDGEPVSDTNKVPVDATLEVGDIEIGAVEIKDGVSDTRATVVQNPGDVTATDNALVTTGWTQIKDADSDARASVVENAGDVVATDNALVTTGYVQGMAAGDAAADGNPVQVGGVYLAAGGTPDEGDVYALLLDAVSRLVVTQGTLEAGEDLAANVLGTMFKPVASSVYSPTSGQNLGAATAISVKATPGNLYFVTVTNANAAVRWLQVHNKTSAPTAGNTALASFLVPAGTATAPGILTLGLNEFAPSMYCSSGVALGVSTVAATYTAATAADHYTNWGFV